MFQVTVYVARMLMEVGKREALFRYVPEFYVEAVVDACHALRGSAADDKAGDSEDGAMLAGPGLSDIIVFLTLYFHDTRIINPDIREALLQSISMLMQSSVIALPHLPTLRLLVTNALCYPKLMQARFNWSPASTSIQNAHRYICSRPYFCLSGHFIWQRW